MMVKSKQRRAVDAQERLHGVHLHHHHRLFLNDNISCMNVPFVALGLLRGRNTARKDIDAARRQLRLLYRQARRQHDL